MAVSEGSDWLEGGYVGAPNYGEIRQYFTDPIFFMRVPQQSPGYSPAIDRASFIREPLYLGRYTPRTSTLQFQAPARTAAYPYSAWQSEFRNESLAKMQWETFQKNWTSTLTFARTKSSLRILEGESWKSL